VHEPANREGGDLTQEVVRRRIDDELRELAIPAELGQRGARPEEIEAVQDVVLEHGAEGAAGVLDDRRVLGRAAHQRHAADLAVAERIGEALHPRVAAALGAVEGQPLAHPHLVALAEPAVVEHQLRGPLVGHVLEQIGEERVPRVGRHDAALARMARLQVVEHRRGVVVVGPVRVLDHRDDRHLHIGALGVVLRRDLDPGVGQPAIAQDRPHLHGIGRAQAAQDPVVVRHLRFPRQSLRRR